MTASRRTYRLYIASQCLLLAGALTAAAVSTRLEDWTPLPLLLLLLVLATVGERLTVTIGSQNLSASFIALVLVATLLGPAPAVTMGIAAVSVDLWRRRPPIEASITNLAAYATCLAAGALLVRTIVGNPHLQANHQLIRSPVFALAVFGTFIFALTLEFVLVALGQHIVLRRPFSGLLRAMLLPMLPGQLAAAILAAILALAYTNLGYPALVAVVLLILIFQYLSIALLRSEDRAEQLQARTVHLASLQLGVLVTLVETLALRDRAAAKHAASTAWYARELAVEVACSEADQDLVHTASLLHDVGKFALPDRILHAEVLSDEDWAAIRRHPQDGATLVGRLDGYGPVADIILYHHEHVDGSGYPAGLIGSEIPLLARVLAVANVYDTLTARESYRPPMTPQDALTELRRVAGRQLDEELVQRFAALAEREGPEEFTKRGQEANFERELAFERRTRALATPTAA